MEHVRKEEETDAHEGLRVEQRPIERRADKGGGRRADEGAGEEGGGRRAYEGAGEGRSYIAGKRRWSGCPIRVGEG